MNSIESTRKGFEESFATGTFYNKQTQDQTHLNQILDCIQVKEGMKILDLGTGTGYMAFPIAEKYRKAEVTGLDIVEKALERNRNRAQEEGLTNLSFVSYDGITFPFEDHTFDMIITRYALHHFPAIQDTFSEISRVLKAGGSFFVSDPTPNEDDSERFVDAYMQMKKDGHIKFYTKEEWVSLGKEAKLIPKKAFETKIRFPKKKETAIGLEEILERFHSDVIKGYELEIKEDEIWILERVNNILFVRE